MTSASFTPDRIARMVEGAAAVAGQTDLTSLLRTTVTTARELTGAAYAALGVLGEHATLIEFHHDGMDQDTVDQIGALPQGRGLLGTITRIGKTVRMGSIADHPDAAGFPPNHPVMTSFLGVPIHVGPQVFGTLYLTDKPGGFTAEDEGLVEALAVIAGSAISTARLQQRLRRVAVVEDRERIARDLHDAIIQDLFAVGLSLQALGQRVVDEAVAGGLTDAVSRLDESIASLRRFIFDLRPPLWVRRDLTAEVADLIGQLSGPYSAEVRLEVDGNLAALSADLVEDALQIVRESVSNALRHSGAVRVEVTITVASGFLTVTVTDNGEGFDPATARRGMGLVNLRERAEKIGGDATVETTVGSGTTVRVRLPV